MPARDIDIAILYIRDILILYRNGLTNHHSSEYNLWNSDWITPTGALIQVTCINFLIFW